MKQILGAALLLAEIIASVWAVDLAFSLPGRAIYSCKSVRLSGIL